MKHDNIKTSQTDDTNLPIDPSSVDALTECKEMFAAEPINSEPEKDAETLVISDGKSAMVASQMLCAWAAQQLSGSGVRMDEVQSALGKRPSARPKFVNCSTGMRLRYFTWGSGEEVVLLLHDITLSAEVWDSVASELADDGYRVYAIDLRGHGSSSRSSDGHYSPSMSAADLESFILELDLYVRPVAVVGVGLGAAAGLLLAAQAPRLVGALMLIEFPFAGVEEMKIDPFTFHPLQALACNGTQTALELLCASCWPHGARQPREAARCIPAMMRVDSTSGRLVMQMDPQWYCNWSVEEMRKSAAGVTCLTGLVCGSQSHMVSKDDLQVMSEIMNLAEDIQTNVLPGLDHNVVSGSSDKVFDCIADFLVYAGPALLRENKEARPPDALGIKVLPQYESLEAAVKALGPRQIPTAEAIDEELRKLALEGGYQSDEDADTTTSRTALAKDPPEYFGFVG